VSAANTRGAVPNYGLALQVNAEAWAQAADLYEELKMPLRAAPCRDKAAGVGSAKP